MTDNFRFDVESAVEEFNVLNRFVRVCLVSDVAFNWEFVKPLIIVGAGVIVSAVALICVYFLIR